MKTGLEALEQRLARLDAKVKVSPGQLGLGFSAAPPVAAAKSAGGGEKCGGGWIDPKKTCRKGEGQGENKIEQRESQPTSTPQVKAGLSPGVISLTGVIGGDKEWDASEAEKRAKGGLKFFRMTRGGNYGFAYYFRDRDAAEHWYAKDVASRDADDIVGSDKRRTSEWRKEYKAAYRDTRNLLSTDGDRGLLETIQAYAESGKATSRGTMVDVRIAGNQHSRPIREGTFGKAADPEPPAEPVLTNPGRIDPGLAPKAKQPGINAQDVTTTAQQAQLARQQRQAAAAAGDQQGAKAWQESERKAERDRLQMAMNRGQQQQSSLFGVTEFDETMPLFRQRRDSVDPVAQLVGQILREQLPGAQVLDWSRPRQGITAGRAVSEGLVYQFRCDSDSIGYQPAWDGIDEQQWELRSEGFLMARDPSARLDYKKSLKFQQSTTKRQCSKGYGCGSACISMNKECRIQPSSAISKVRLRQLQALAQEGDAKAAARAQELQMERDAKAQGLQQGRQTAKLQELLKDPRVAEMVRTGKIPESGGQGSGSAPQPGQVQNIRPDELEVDPERFQYKIGSSATGEVGSLSGVQRWDPNLAGVISVWQDPEDGKTYVVNGHNRLALSKRLGAEEVTVRYLKAKDAQEARAIGAMQNIAEGAGSEIDAGKFFRDTGVKTLQEVKNKGLPLTSGKAQAGLALAQLPDEMFQDVVQGNLRMRRAAVIGGSGLDQDKQREVYKVLKARPSMTDETLQEYVQHLEVSTRQNQTEIDLFGANETSVDTGLARAELANGLKKALGREARLLGAVSKTQQAKELLEQKGGNVINVEQSQQQASEASSVLRTFDQLKNLSGPIRSALDEAAARVTAGENRNKVARELREAVVQAMEEELRNAGLKPDQPPRDELTMNLFDSADRFAAIEARLDALKRKCSTGYACGSACISPAKECRSEGGQGGTSKERMQRLEQIAQGGKAGRGIGQLRGEAAAAKAEEIRGNRSARAAQLRQERSQRRQGGPGSPSTPDSFTANEAIALQVLANGKLKSDRSRVAEMVRLGVPPDTDMLQLVWTAREKLGGRDWWKDESGWKDKLRRFAGAAANPDNSAIQPVGKVSSSPSVPARPSGGKPGGIADTMRQALNAMKAADARQMGVMAEQLFETNWILERRGRYRGMSKDQAREAYKVEFAKNLQQADQARRQRGPSDAARRAGEAGSVAGAMRSLIEDMKASDKNLENLTNQVIDLRVQAEEFNEGGDEGALGGSTGRRQLGGSTRRGRGRRKDSADDWFEALLSRMDAVRRKCQTGYGCGSTCISVKKECRSEGGAGAISKERINRLEQLSKGEIKPRGLGVPKPAEAAAMAEEIKGRRTSRAQELVGGRQATREAKAAEEAAARAAEEAKAKKPVTAGKAPKGSPRAEAETVEGSGDYEFARKSAISNAGEDLVNSARHKRNAFRTIEEAEASGEVEKLLTRDNLLKNFPTDLLDGISPHNVLARMEAHLSLRAFPNLSAKEVQSYLRAAERRRENGTASRGGKPIEEVDAKTVRKQYFDAFQVVRQFVEDNRDMEPGLLRRELAKALTGLIASYRGEEGEGYYRTYRDPFNPTANALIDMQRRLVKTGSSSVYGQMNAFAKALNEAGKLNTSDARSTLEQALEPARRIIEGESLAKAFGQENTSGKWRFTAGTRYVGDAKREGGRKVGGTPQAATDEIIKGLGFRGLQYGNSVTDDERAHHVQKAAEALVDLADAIGLPDQAIGLNGTLGLAIGARGRGGAAAHYEPDLKVINLTRKNGVGSLSHEWGHALDNYVSGGSNFLSEYRGIGVSAEARKAMGDLQNAWQNSGFQGQVYTTLREIRRAGGMLTESYWLDPKEMLARSFEAHVSLKLAKAGRSNTYLTRELHEGGMRKGEERIRRGDGLWPSREQAEAMEPFFDALIAQLGKEHFPGTVRRDSRDARIRRFARMLGGA